MRVVIAGSRTILDYEQVVMAILLSGFPITEVVCGMARGPDTLGRTWANINKIPVREFPAEWDKYGLSAGARRNYEMAGYCDAAIIVWDGKSIGSLHMMNEIKRLGKKCFVHKIVQSGLEDMLCFVDDGKKHGTLVEFLQLEDGLDE